MYALDLSIFDFIHGLAGRSSLVDNLIIVCANYLIYFVILYVAVAAACAWYKGNKNHAVGYVLALASGVVARFGVATLIRHFYDRSRPFVALNISHLINDAAASFPSGHTIFMFALATVVYKFNKTMGWWLYGIGLLIGIARVAAGVHYPTDILGGILLGILTGWIVALLWGKFSDRFI